MPTIQTGWLRRKDGERFAPKTLLSQIVSSDGESLDEYLDTALHIDIEDNENVKVLKYGEPEFELIESIEVTEENIKSVKRTSEPDGTPYNFKKVRVFVSQPPYSGTNNGKGAVLFTDSNKYPQYAYASTMAYSENAFNTSNNSYAIYDADVSDKYLNTSAAAYTLSSENDTYKNLWISTVLGTNLFVIKREVTIDKIECVEYKSANGFVIPVGTKIDIYGMRFKSDEYIEDFDVEISDVEGLPETLSRAAYLESDTNEEIVDKTGKFEFIEHFEVTEELARFERTQEPNGTPYNFQKVKVIIKQPKASNSGSGGITCIDNINNPSYKSVNAYIIGDIQAFDTAAYTFSQYNAKIDEGFLKGDAVTIRITESINDVETFIKTSGYRTGKVTKNLFDVCEYIPLEKIEYLRYGSLNAYKIPVGTTIDIYAVR